MIKLVTDYLDNTVLKYPDKIAFCDEWREISYKFFKQESLAVAMILINKRVYRKPVLTLLPKSIDNLSSFMGVAYSGNFYTPIDIDMPKDRIQKIITVLKPEVIITNKDYYDIVKNIGFDNNKIIIFNDISFDMDIDEDIIKNITASLINTDLIYVLFTSGSTGIPKGVSISHGSVIDYTEWIVDTFDITEKTVFANQAPFYFDLSVSDIYSTLKTGATLCIAPKKIFSFPIHLLEYIRDNNVNTVFWVPSALIIVSNMRGLGTVDISCLQKVLFIGEVMPNKHLNLWRKELPHTMFANLYGPTEIAVVCTYYIINREFSDNDPLPIGIPCNNTNILVIDDDKNLIEKSNTSDIGELCVRGSSLSLGYYNNWEQTEKVFIQNPLHNNYKDIIYCTGDIVKYNEYGELLFLSRKDFQIKHRGHRVELGEIEVAANSLEYIINACCLYDQNKSKIVLFFQSDKNEKDIKLHLKALLPEYMIPNKYEKIEKMPLNMNSKIDRNKLKELL